MTAVSALTPALRHGLAVLLFFAATAQLAHCLYRHGGRHRHSLSAPDPGAFGGHGRRRFRLELVPGAGFTPPEGSETMTGVVRKGDRGWFPLSGLLALDQTEVRMLEADLAALVGPALAKRIHEQLNHE